MGFSEGEILCDQKYERLRHGLFRPMGLGIITGVNIYGREEPKKQRFRLSYLYGKLDDDHSKALKDTLQIHGFDPSISTSLYVSRISAYKLKLGWEEEVEEFYYPSGERIEDRNKAKEAIKNKEPVIGVAKQQELRIDVDRTEDLVHLLEVFRTYTNYWVVQKDGTLLKEKSEKIVNKLAIDHSWDVPMIVVDSDEDLEGCGYLPVKKVGFLGYDEIVTSLIHRKFDERLCGDTEILPSFVDYFKENEYEIIKDKVFANRIFVDFLDEVDWEHVKWMRKMLV